SFRAPRGKGRYREPRNNDSIAEIQSTNFRSHMQAYHIVFAHKRSEVKPDAKRSKLDCDCPDVCSPLHNRYRELPAREKACFLATQGQQVGLREDLQHRFIFEIANRGS